MGAARTLRRRPGLSYLLSAFRKTDKRRSSTFRTRPRLPYWHILVRGCEPERTPNQVTQEAQAAYLLITIACIVDIYFWTMLFDSILGWFIRKWPLLPETTNLNAILKYVGVGAVLAALVRLIAILSNLQQLVNYLKYVRPLQDGLQILFDFFGFILSHFATFSTLIAASQWPVISPWLKRWLQQIDFAQLLIAPLPLKDLLVLSLGCAFPIAIAVFEINFYRVDLGSGGPAIDAPAGKKSLVAETTDWLLSLRGLRRHFIYLVGSCILCAGIFLAAYSLPGKVVIGMGSLLLVAALTALYGLRSAFLVSARIGIIAASCWITSHPVELQLYHQAIDEAYQAEQRPKILAKIYALLNELGAPAPELGQGPVSAESPTKFLPEQELDGALQATYFRCLEEYFRPALNPPNPYAEPKCEAFSSKPQSEERSLHGCVLHYAHEKYYSRWKNCLGGLKNCAFYAPRCGQTPKILECDKGPLHQDFAPRPRPGWGPESCTFQAQITEIESMVQYCEPYRLADRDCRARPDYVQGAELYLHYRQLAKDVNKGVTEFLSTYAKWPIPLCAEGPRSKVACLKDLNGPIDHEACIAALLKERGLCLSPIIADFQQQKRLFGDVRSAIEHAFDAEAQTAHTSALARYRREGILDLFYLAWFLSLVLPTMVVLNKLTSSAALHEHLSAQTELTEDTIGEDLVRQLVSLETVAEMKALHYLAGSGQLTRTWLRSLQRLLKDSPSDLAHRERLRGYVDELLKEQDSAPKGATWDLEKTVQDWLSKGWQWLKTQWGRLTRAPSAVSQSIADKHTNAATHSATITPSSLAPAPIPSPDPLSTSPSDPSSIPPPDRT